MWEEELALHALETPVAENAVLRQRNIDWKFRSDTAGHAHAMMEQLYPFVAKVRAERGSEAAHARVFPNLTPPPPPPPFPLYFSRTSLHTRRSRAR